MNFTFTVFGIPVTQGSTKAFVVAGRARITHDKREPLLNWRNAIGFSAREAMPEGFPSDGPVAVYATFALPRPKSAPKKVVVPAKKPDLDKLARGLLDSLTGVVINDDSQVIHLELHKQFATEQFPPGVIVEVNSWDCGDDAYYGFGGKTIESAIERIAADTIKRRGKNWRPAEVSGG